MSALLELRDIEVAYGDRVAVRDGTLVVGAGEAVGLVGRSGSGKSTLVAATVGLLAVGGRVVDGTASLRGEDLLAATPERLRELRGAEIGYVTQDAMRALNPSMRAGAQVAEAMTVHGASQAHASARIGELLGLVGLVPEHGRAYPHELSGGQRQRVAIAAAIANEPTLLIADEPTTGLDVVVQRHLLDLLAGVRERMDMALVLISHDERVVDRLCDRVERMPSSGSAPTPRSQAARTTGAARSRDRRRDADSAPLLELRGVSATYRRRSRHEPAVPALRDVDLELLDGEALGLVGRSGAGKTTLALLALGLVEPSAGEVRLRGEPLQSLGVRALRRRRAGMHLIFQDPYDALPEGIAVERVLAEPLTIRGERRPDPDQIREALERAGLSPVSEFLGRAPEELSGGERQRLALARAIIARPRLVLADEPTSMLDAELRLELVDRMRAACELDGTSFLFITHDLVLARRFCDRLMVLHEGRVIESGPADEVLAAPRAPETRALLEAATL